MLPTVIRRTNLRASTVLRYRVSPYSSGSSIHDGDPELLEKEKHRNLKKEQHLTSTPHDHENGAPGWNEYLASASEAHADKYGGTGPPTPEMAKKTLKQLHQRYNGQQTPTNSGEEAGYEKDEVEGPLRTSTAGGQTDEHEIKEVHIRKETVETRSQDVRTHAVVPVWEQQDIYMPLNEKKKMLGHSGDKYGQLCASGSCQHQHRNMASSSRRLPVLSLENTLSKYLTSLEPFLREDECQGKNSFTVEMEKRVQWAEEFKQGIGIVLQDRLLALDKASPHNWLDDNFWMKVAYLTTRSSLLINSNWWCLFRPDSTIPALTMEPHLYTFWQIRRAAWLIHKALLYRNDIEQKAINNHLANVLNTKAQNLAEAVPFQLPFHRCRIPQLECDKLASLPIRGSPMSRNIILMLRDWIYAVEVLDENDLPLPVAEIEWRIRNAVHDANWRHHEGLHAVPVGSLTTHDRDSWAKARQHLVNLSPRNLETLRYIEDSIMVLSLDDYTRTPSTSDRPAPFKNADLDAHVKNCSSGSNGRNRWYDKCVSFFVESSGRAGALGEHSPCDGLVVGAVLHYCLGEHINTTHFPQDLGDTPISVSMSGVIRLDWVTDDYIRRECIQAEEQARLISEDSDASMLTFEDFGSAWIKEVARQSPDSFAQMAMQLAWHKAQGDFTATYETATTQIFAHGRTEVIRTFSSESWQFVRAMVDSSCTKSIRFRRLQEAIKAHNAYTRDAVKGRGVDRHLLGLRLLMQPGETANLFEDPLFRRSENWRLSTSGLYHGERFAGTGFGSPYPDGYGIQYVINVDDMNFGIESKHSCNLTSTERFKEALVDSLREMRTLYEDPTTDITAKL